MRSEDRLLKALFGEPRFWASYEEMAVAAEKLRSDYEKLKEDVIEKDKLLEYLKDQIGQ